MDPIWHISCASINYYKFYYITHNISDNSASRPLNHPPLPAPRPRSPLATVSAAPVEPRIRIRGGRERDAPRYPRVTRIPRIIPLLTGQVLVTRGVVSCSAQLFDSDCTSSMAAPTPLTSLAHAHAHDKRMSLA